MKERRQEHHPAQENGLSISIKKAVDKNTNSQDKLERELKNVEMKRKASLREIILKQDAFIKRQLKWQSKVLAEQTSSRRVSLDVSRMINNGALHQHIRRQSLSILQESERFSSRTNGASSGSTLFSKQKRLSLPALLKYQKGNRGSERTSTKNSVGSGTNLPRLQRL